MKITCPVCQTEDVSCEEHDFIENECFEVCISREAIWKEGKLIAHETTEGYDSPVEEYKCVNDHVWYM